MNNKPKTLEEALEMFDETFGRFPSLRFTQEGDIVKTFEIAEWTKVKSFLTTIWHAGRESVVGDGATVTKQHSMKCPKLYGEECKCDGYHTFDELYEHRIVLYIALCKALKNGNVWCSTKHSDGSEWQDWFILGIWFEKGKQITYHLPARYWNEVCEFAQVLEKAPEFDGHSSDDVLVRVSALSDVITKLSELKK